MADGSKVNVEASAGSYTGHWMGLLGVSELGGRDYTPVVEGEIPSGLNGTLYRNGPGLFERGGVRKRGVLDGDGLLQALTFGEKGIRYQNRFVETEKFTEEAASGQFRHATWTTRRPGGLFRNLGGGDMISQAGVTVYLINDRLVARDETGDSYIMDPAGLGVQSVFETGDPSVTARVGYKAHSTVDPKTGDWILLGQEFGKQMKLHVTTYGPDFRLKSSYSFTAPRQVYIHDFMVTEQYVIAVLHPCYISPFSFIAGLKSLTDGMRWNAGDGNIVALYPRAGGEPTFLEAPAAFMWHPLGAYEKNGTIIADFVGYDDPDHFIGEDPLVNALMQGRLGNAKVPGTVRRYHIDPAKHTLREEVLDTGTHEFPMQDDRNVMQAHTYGYFGFGGLSAANDGLKRLHMQTGQADIFRFEGDIQVGEPVFVPREGGGLDEGYLIAQCLDGEAKKTFFGIWDAQTLAAGPLSKVWLSHHVPISFHGAWSAA